MKYLKYIWVRLQLSIIREMQFRTNFLANILVGFLESAMLVIFYSVLIHRNIAFDFWGEGEVYLFLGTFLIVNNLYKIFFDGGVSSLTQLIKTGELDGLLMKPLSERFLLAFNKINIGPFPNLFIGLYLIGRSGNIRVLINRPTSLLLYLILIMAGVYFLYLAKFLLTCSSFWIVNSSELETIFNTLLEFADKPYMIYPRWIHLIFSYGTVFFLAGNYQVMAVTGRIDCKGLMGVGVSLVFWTFLTKKLWQKGLKIYHGASR